MKIRPATSDDIPAMMALEGHAVTAAHWSREQYDAVLSGGGIRRVGLVLEEDSKVQAFIVARAIGKEREIENIAVAGPARRRGLGTRLLGEFLELARAEGAETVFLEVRASNQAARFLYEKWAFLEAGRRKAYYRNPVEDAVVCRLTLR